MVDADLGRDLMSFNTPILVLGDPAQLPPVKGGGFFTDHAPDQMLTEIHRQAVDNPIVRLANDVREGRDLEFGHYGTSRVMPRADLDADIIMKADQVLVGKNQTRHLYNKRMRELAGRQSDMPEPGDRLVCLKNNRTNGLFNGGLFEVAKLRKPVPGAIQDNTIRFDILSSDFTGQAAITVKVRKEFFAGGHEQIDWKDLRGTDQFNYGYALTVHKAQGSQWGNVVLFDESHAFRSDWRRWLYTGITRAAETITIVR
jgi:exodeoxyribonuclease-5